MFSLIRGLVIIGLIFYFSPARDIGDIEPSPAAAKPHPASTESQEAQGRSKLLDGLLSRLAGGVTEDVVRTAAYDKAQSAALRLRDSTSWSLPDSTPKTTSDGRRSATSEAALRTSAAQGVRCVYRCDASE
jgi:hypothetical protein